MSSLSRDEDDWTVWGFTAVIHRNRDTTSKLFGVISLIPQMLIIAFVASDFTQWNRSLIEIQIGVAISEVINFVLKNSLREARPAHPCPFAGRSDYGMPSSHAQFVFCFATLCSMYLWKRLHFAEGKRRKTSVSPSKKAAVLLCVLALFTMAVGVCVSRVWNSYHTVGQVCVGGLVGVLLALVIGTEGTPLYVAVQWLTSHVAQPILHSWFCLVAWVLQ